MLVLNQSRCSAGYSLIELVISIVLTSIVMVIFFTVFANPQKISVEPVFQVKATELAQAYLEEISLKRFDEVSPAGNALRCNAPSAPVCSASLASDPGENRARYDDIDDYNGLSDNPPRDALGNVRAGFNSFTVNVAVSYAGSDFGMPAQDLKRVQVTVQSPDDLQYVFSQYRSNF